MHLPMAAVRKRETAPLHRQAFFSWRALCDAILLLDFVDIDPARLL